MEISASMIYILTNKCFIFPHKLVKLNFRTPECPFLHAKGERSIECKYGVDCTRSECVFSHPIGTNLL